MVAACDGEVVARRRDRAIVLLLVRLGLRAGDVAQLHLDDIEWETGSLRVSGKSRYEVRLPLPQDVQLDEHLESERDEDGSGNRRNGSSRKTVLTGTSKMTLSIPRDRAGTFDPKLIAKYQRRFPDFDEKIISMYARGMTVREIQGHLAELYGIEVSPDLISGVTDAVLEEVTEWQNRPLELCYPLVFFDAIRVKIRDEGFVRNKAVYIALAILADGTKEILGLWIEQTEGAKFWLRVMNELKNRGCQDILIAVVDGLKGFPEAITAAFPQTTVQTCVVHLIRHSLEFVSYKDRKPVVPALRAIYRAKDAEAGLKALEAFEAGYWGQKYPAISQSWRRNWEQVIPFFAFPEGVRRIIYTTNAIEALNSKLRRAVRTRGHFPNDEAAMKLLYLVLNNAAEEWKRPPREWVEAKTQFAIVFGERFFNR
ncbi:IS256 family transposase [Rhizobium mongolense]|uniref:IS256 family transposase n=1 Tax=Rhizobium mongolense TaxID=57676 RepID=UPI003F5D659E